MRNVGVAPPGHRVLPLQVWRRDCSDILKVCHPRSTRTTDRVAQGEGEPLTKLRAYLRGPPCVVCSHTPGGYFRPPFHSLVDGRGEGWGWGTGPLLLASFQAHEGQVRSGSASSAQPGTRHRGRLQGRLLGRARRCVVTGQAGGAHPGLRKRGDVSLRQRLKLFPSAGAWPFSHFSKLVFKVWFTHGTVHVCVSMSHWAPV